MRGRARIRDQLALWAAGALGTVINQWPDMPAGVTDRDADVWEALLAVADAAGGTWPERGRAAAVALVTESKASSPSLGIRLLSDLRDIFVTAQKMFTKTILEKLHVIDESPWADIKGKALTDTQLARRLGAYGIKPKLVRLGEDVSRGYDRSDFYEAWKRYLPALGASGVTPVTHVTEGQK